ncbi:putative nuclease HARBI1 isoform X2 [Rhagoletis pomonella]|uniref:putative nuclease HARBI1 isoform X2 n=1 Tax=Rhagoletis pomonella TaxID=28610 RepID=UPI0017807AF0|nr:putative nuclease HARBI1 isoform X2 [Rhagoletis pomonella]
MGYPQCIGAIGRLKSNAMEKNFYQKRFYNTDGCHIEIHPKKEEAIDYPNYKGWYSVVLLALIDAKYRFSYIHCGSPGRCNDSSIFEKSSLKRELQECALLDELSWQYGSTKIPVHVIGDSAFRLSQHLMKPYPHSVNNTPEQKKINYRLSKCRRVVENAFGHLKARFRRIGKGVDNHIKNANTVICAACVLHNFLIAQKDSIVENRVVEMQRDSRCNPQCSNNQSDRSEGELIRNSLKEYFRVETSLGAGDDDAENVGDESTGSEEHEGEIGDVGGIAIQQ